MNASVRTVVIINNFLGHFLVTFGMNACVHAVVIINNFPSSFRLFTFGMNACVYPVVIIDNFAVISVIHVWHERLRAHSCHYRQLRIYSWSFGLVTFGMNASVRIIVIIGNSTLLQWILRSVFTGQGAHNKWLTLATKGLQVQHNQVLETSPTSPNTMTNCAFEDSATSLRQVFAYVLKV
jgi:hypothetical protein